MHHFSHPFHRLQEVYIDEEFWCNGCNSPGHGKRYRCTVCPSKSSFQLHDHCATCPASITSEFHAEHKLSLVNLKELPEHKLCTLCSDEVNGLYYTCMKCKGFNVHPLCTKLPMRVLNAGHSQHMLTLQPVSQAGRCMICKGGCCKELWRYQCEKCSNVGAHIECAFTVASPPSQTAPVASKSAQKSPMMTDERFIVKPQNMTPVGWHKPPPQAARPPPPPKQDYNHCVWINGHPYPYPYPYPYYRNVQRISGYPPYPNQQHGQSSSPKPRRRIYSVLGDVAARVAFIAFADALLN